MGRKSAAKFQARSSSPASGEPPSDKPASSKSLLAAAIVVAAAVVGVFVATRSAQTDQPATQSAPVAAATAVVDPPPAAKLGPHKQERLPPLPFQEYAPPRPPDVVRAAYVFAAEHPEILSYVPCFCGCERSGHKGNEDCFVAARDANGDVTQWEPHGLECTVCLDVARDSEQMFRSGASVTDIRNAIEKKWAGFQGGHTPTPHPMVH